ncbi:peptide ABC transporter permease [Longispora fulva]|uniref:Putative ABC transport system permease protein n=1 Tax=Longispora fulva TaxID=619741 RepID=A0A8J7GSE7_9ACTN|nr:ABC transporter permease [Longispora fulva]MBG6139115.1 putative ABC transport system permease protein [Longispora fulva]GIG58607.1 peptide ABC transporter permease [Longispora fulva]
MREAVRGLSANKLRSALTVLGILIGVGAVIMLVAYGNGSAKAVQSSIESLGSNTLTVQGNRTGGGRAATAAQAQSGELTLADAESLLDRSLVPDALSVSPIVTTSLTAVRESTSHPVPQVIGTEPGYLAASNTKLASGELFGEGDNRRVVVLGQTVAGELFGRTSPLGQTITLGGVRFTVSGVLAAKDTAGFTDPNDTVIVPIGALRESVSGYGALSSILVQAASADTTDLAQVEVLNVLNARHRVTSATSPFRVQNQAQLLATRTATADTFTFLLGAVAAISLLVGGIGVTNIMLVTVTERTREIGIRKALGAPRGTILGQFLLEATALSLIGGGLGVLVALIGSTFTIGGVQPVIVPSSVALALGVSVAIGLFFGSFPAHRAASMRPIEALRYE